MNLSRFRVRNKKIIAGLSTLFLLIVAATAGGTIYINVWLKGENPLEPWIAERFLPPSFHHPLGTTQNGQDVLGCILVGLKNTLIVGIIAGSISTLISISLGFISAYKGGVTDYAIKSGTDFMLLLPSWPILAIVAAYARKINLVEMALILAIFIFYYHPKTTITSFIITFIWILV